jgi:hypothetical protein
MTNIVITFAENIKENIFEYDNGKLNVTYDYDKYETSILYRSDYEKFIEQNQEMLLEKAKQEDRKKLEKKIREKRNQLLAESDCEMALDRLNISIPDGNTFASWKPFLKSLGDKLSGDWARYRQALRDIPTQEGFPYKVQFPEKPC